MSDIIANNKRIAKNTLFLYFRMILVMGVTLYTSRIILESLGDSGYGLYSVIGGIVALFSIISGSLSSAISRFFTYELGTGNFDRLRLIFSSSVCIQILLSIGMILVFTPVSIWFINNKMNIPDGDYTSAYWVLGFSIVTFCVNLMSVPFNAAIVSHEEMSVFSYVSVIEVCLKLGISYLVTVFDDKRVIVYAALLLGVSVIVQTIYMLYCRRKFPECRISPRLNLRTLKEIGGFAGWNFIGVASGVLRNQGNNIILNLFYGTVVNAAYAIAMQVNNAVSQLSDNFMVSVNPQITKYCASQEINEMHKLIFRSSKLSFFLTWILVLPIIVNTPYILYLWLVDVPSNTAVFVQLIMICAASESVSKPLITAMLATGKIRNYQIVVGGLQMMNLPISYVILKIGGSAYWPLVVVLIISQLCLIARLYMLRGMINLKVWQFMRQVYFKDIAVVILSLLLPVIILIFLPNTESFGSFTFRTITYILWTSVVILFIGLTASERSFICDRLKSVIKKYKR